MGELTVVVVIQARAGSEEALSGLLIEAAGPTRFEAGCKEWRPLNSDAEPGTFVIVERWRAFSDYEAHLATDHVRRFLSAAEPHVDSLKIHRLRGVSS